MRRESLLSPERTWVIMKVVAVGLVPRSSWERRVVPLSGPGRGGRGGALGITVELHFASSFLWKCFCTVPPSPHHVLWCQGPRRRGPAAEESGAAGASARSPCPSAVPCCCLRVFLIARRWLGSTRLHPAALCYFLWCAAVRS